MRKCFIIIIDIINKFSLIVFMFSAAICTVSEFTGVPGINRLLAKIHTSIQIDSITKIGCLFLLIFLLTLWLIKKQKN